MLNDITVTDIKEIFTVFSPKGRYEKIIKRKSYGLSFCIDGRITYTHNGVKTVSDCNNAVILPKDRTYTLYGDKTGTFTVINFNCNEQLCNTVTAIPIQNAEAYIKDFEKCRSLSFFDGNRAEIMSVFYHILHSLSMQNSSCKVILPAVKYIEKNYQKTDLTNSELAAKCNISEVYFRRMFNKYYKMTPKQFITEIRINNAKQLLSEGALKINAVAEKCGFSNQYHFCRVFKQKTGLTPTSYMKRNRICKI